MTPAILAPGADNALATRPRTVLVVDDEHTIAEAIATRLRSEGFRVEVANDGVTAVEQAKTLRPDLVVLDLMLPGLDGLEVCRRMQANSRVPVVMLTARAEETDVLVGLGVGADDYVTKPFSPRELVARIHAVLRRADLATAGSGAADRHEATEERRFQLGDAVLDLGARTATRAGEEVHLTATEFDLASWLLTHPGTVFSRAQLMRSVWGYEDAYGERTVDSHVQAIRRKLGSSFVRTVHGVGYGLGRNEQWPNSQVRR